MTGPVGVSNQASFTICVRARLIAGALRFGATMHPTQHQNQWPVSIVMAQINDLVEHTECVEMRALSPDIRRIQFARAMHESLLIRACPAGNA